MGLKKFFQRITPAHHEIREHKHLQILGDILHDPNIFHLTRRSTAGGVAIGLFVAFIPLPGHTLYAALLAIYLRLNLPLAILFSWISNPFTIPPLFFLAYKTGTMILHEPVQQITFELSFGWLREMLMDSWGPLLLGCLVLGLAAAGAGYLCVRLLWRLAVLKKWEERRQRQLQETKPACPD